MTTIEHFPFSDTARVPFRDLDAQGHLFFANYLAYADEFATCYLTELGVPAVNVDAMDCYVFVVNAQCDFLGECGGHDVIRGHVGFSRLGRSSADMAFELRNDATGEVLTRGHFTYVFADKQTRRSTAIPERLRAAIVERQPELAAGGAGES
jgi:acyl-CoA thioester hydrolase